MNLSLGLKIKALRKARGLNQTQMAKELGVHFQTISRYERGVLEPSSEVLSVLAQKFHVNANFLLECQELSQTLPPGTDLTFLKLIRSYFRPEIHTKEEAIDRVVRILEELSEERVREVLAYTEEKNELRIYQSVGRASRNDPVPVFGEEEKGKKM